MEHVRAELHAAFEIAADPDRRIGTIDLLAPAERQRPGGMEHHPGPGRDVTGEAVSIPELFARQVQRVPDATAVVFADRTLTYTELDTASNRLARLLIAEGIGPERIVALALPKSADMIVAILAVLKTGAAYLPIDPHYPTSRKEFMLHDAAPTLIITTSHLHTTLNTPTTPVLNLDTPTTTQRLTTQHTTPVTDHDRLTPCTHTTPPT
ncbi:AMP-binding protein [Streptomyces hygroscopicus]|uniref:AMP-binding protein n=1 Tax=Streptomyces hygroscopicus TaxID=1912 RepID=UPI003F1945DE